MTRPEPYAEYKDTGIEWLGRVPSHWGVVPIKRRATTGAGAGFPQELQGVPDGEIPFYKVNSLAKASKDGVIDFLDEAISRDTAISLRAEIYPAGSAVLAKIGAALLLGRIRTLGVDACIDNNMMSVQADKGTHPRFLYYALTLIRFDLLVNPGAVPSTSERAVAEWKLAFPGLEEQQSIAAFLDRETAQIDDLIGKQERLIDLLAEKREAIITQAVTTGLDPNTPTKPSGIMGLGEVPESWDVSTIKRQWTVVDCKHVTAEFVEEGTPLASIREVQGKYVNLANAKSTTAEFYSSMIDGNREPRAGDLIFSRNATVGEVAIVPEDFKPFAMGQDVCMLKRQSIDTNPNFSWYALRSRYVQEQVILAMIGSTFKRINVEDIRAITYCVPPPEEQRAIAKYLDEKVSVLDRAMSTATAGVRLLRERRAALISAAVTGKFDLRESAAQL